MGATAKHWLYGERPKVAELFGDPSIKPESAEHIISFPGGSIAVCRTDDGDYWAHVLINRRQVLPNQKGLSGARGTVVSSRLGLRSGAILDLPDEPDVEQIAVMIRIERPIVPDFGLRTPA